MKKTILSICLFVLSILNIQAQEIWMTYDLKIKKGMSEKTIKKKRNSYYSIWRQCR